MVNVFKASFVNNYYKQSLDLEILIFHWYWILELEIPADRFVDQFDLHMLSVLLVSEYMLHEEKVYYVIKERRKTLIIYSRNFAFTNAGNGIKYRNKLNIIIPSAKANVIPRFRSSSKIPLNIFSVCSLLYLSARNDWPFAYLQNISKIRKIITNYNSYYDL